MEQDLYRKAVEKFGDLSQILMAVEEMAELQKALLKRVRYGCEQSRLTEVLDNIREEMADVEIMLEQLRVIFGDSAEWRTRKLKHLAEIVGYEGEV